MSTPPGPLRPACPAAPEGTPDRVRRLWLSQGLAWGAAATGLPGLTGCASPAVDTSPAASSLQAAESPQAAAAPLRPAARVAPFSRTRVGRALPAGWQPYVLRHDKPITRYAIVPEGPRTVLHAHAAAAATGLQCPVQIDTGAGARVGFSWRVQDVPANATVQEPGRDDAPARIVLAFDGDIGRLSLRERLFYDQVELFTGQRLPYATLMYVWDGALPTERVVQNHRTSRIRYLTVESGSGRAGQWLHYERDVVADFERAFGERPGLITSVGVLTDSDALKHEQQAWYGDIELRVPARG